MKSSNSHKLWFSFHKDRYDGSDPKIFDAKEFTELEILISKRLELKKAALEYISLKNSKLTPYFNASIIDKPDTWKIGVFCKWGLKKHRELSKAPFMTEMFNSIDSVISWSISILEPGGEVLPHTGDSNGIIRCHFGVSIPEGLPHCGLRLEDKLIEWKEGDLAMFCDAYNHSAFNKTNKQRIIVIFDMINPRFKAKKNKIKANGISILWSQALLAKLGLSQAHWIIRAGVRKICLWYAYVYVPLHNSLKVI